jgi:uncharacterized protein YcgI (DUF1989 family)
MTVIEDMMIAKNTGKSFVVKQGQRIRISAESIVDLVVFNLENLRERFDQARTKANQGKVFISTGDMLYSKLNNVMMTIVEDTYKGKHDLQYGTCSRASYDVWWERRDTSEFKNWFKEYGITKREDLPLHGCYENLNDATRDYEIAPEDIPSPFNLFTSVEIDPSGKLVWCIDRDRPEPDKPAHIDLRAEIDCLVVISACPEMGKLGKAKAVKVQVYQD